MVFHFIHVDTYWRMHDLQNILSIDPENTEINILYQSYKHRIFSKYDHPMLRLKMFLCCWIYASINSSFKKTN